MSLWLVILIAAAGWTILTFVAAAVIGRGFAASDRWSRSHQDETAVDSGNVGLETPSPSRVAETLTARTPVYSQSMASDRVRPSA